MPNTANLRQTWKNLEPRGQITLVGCALATLVVIFFLFRFSSQPSYTTIETGLNPADTGKITQALDSAGVKYQIQNGGTQVSVVSSQESAARVALASSGAAPGSPVGFEIFDHQSMGATDFQQQVDYQRALEGEIARTIMGIDGITGAQVQLVLPKDTLFNDQQSQASAAVMLDDSGAVDSSTISGIAHLVASSVQGLDVQKVTITDQSGAQLWPTTGLGAAGGSTDKLSAEQSFNQQQAAIVNAMLAERLGADKAQVAVNADLNMDQTTIDETTYGTKAIPLSTQTSTEKLTGGANGAGGVAGASSNTPPFPVAGSSASGSGSNYTNTQKTTSNSVTDTKHTQTTQAQGTVNRLSVGLMVSSSLKPADVTQVKSMVASALGLDPQRGDTMTVSSLPFAATSGTATQAASAGPLGLDPMTIGRYAGLGLALALFLFFARRNLKSREGEAIAAEPTWLREISGTMPLAQLEAAPTQVANRSLDPGVAKLEQAKQEVGDIVRQRPEQVAAQVSQWLNEK